MEKTYWPLDKLREWDKNPRSITKEGFERLKRQLLKEKEQTGDYLFKPLLINQEGEVLGGNMRLKALREIGAKEVWVSVVKTNKEQDKLDYALRDNDQSGKTEKDELLLLIEEFPELHLEDYAVNFDPPELLSDFMDQFKEVKEDEVHEVAEGEPVSKLGDVYTLGRHRLGCLDAIKRGDVDKLMDGQKADMVFTDPPYGVNYEGKTKDKLKLQNDLTTKVWAEALPNFIEYSKAGASYYVCCPAGNNFIDYLKPFSEYCYQSQTIIWAKNSMVLGHGDYHYQHEPILYGWAKGATHKYYGDRSQTTLWNINRPTVSKHHPTMKPLVLVIKAIKNSSKEDDIVLDLFSGSGSTLIACEQTNRTCYMMEIDPKYCDVIRKRYAKFINKEDQWEKETPKIS